MSIPKHIADKIEKLVNSEVEKDTSIIEEYLHYFSKKDTNFLEFKLNVLLKGLNLSIPSDTFSFSNDEVKAYFFT